MAPGAPAADLLAEACTTPEALDFGARLAAAKARPRLTVHAFHRWYGKLIPAIPAAAVEAFTSPGDLVLDPFCGSGTTLVEAVAAGREARGHDVNPLATLLARVKAAPPSPERLSAAAEGLSARMRQGSAEDWRAHLPALPNLEHFYPDDVARDLVRLYAAARAEEGGACRDWLLALASAINRDVSNADTRHVFPGVSKAMRAAIAGGWKADVPGRLERALRKRLRASAEIHALAQGAPRVAVHQAPLADAPPAPGSAQLVVTNPPYVSSIRYVETFKLEAWWLGLVSSGDELRALDARCLGTERVAAGAVSEHEIERCPPCCAPLAADLTNRGEAAMARVVLAYAEGLAQALGATARALAPGGHAVVKLAASRLRGVTIPTPRLCADLLARHDLRLVGALEDRYDPSSRTLTTARNWYSGRMDADLLLIFRKAAR